MKDQIFKFLVLFGVFGIIILLGYYVLRKFGLDDLETLRNILNKGFWGYFIYILLQILQVLFIPLSATMFTVPAIILFGPTKAFLLTWFGCMIGSILMYFIGKKCGGKLLKWLVGDEKSKKYAKMLKKAKYLFPMFLLIPIFPDDLICVSAGTAKINFIYFFIVVFLTRAIDLACTCYIGSTLVKSVTGMIILSVFVLIMLVVSIIVTKNQDKIDKWFAKKFTKKKTG